MATVKDERLEPLKEGYISIIDRHGPAQHGRTGVWRLAWDSKKWVWYDLTNNNIVMHFIGGDMGRFMTRLKRRSRAERVAWLTMAAMGDRVVCGNLSFDVVGDIERYPPVPRAALGRKKVRK